jgi:hypothetical protein
MKSYSIPYFLWFSYGFPIVFLWFSCGFPVVFLWFSHVLSFKGPWVCTPQVVTIADGQPLGLDRWLRFDAERYGSERWLHWNGDSPGFVERLLLVVGPAHQLRWGYSQLIISGCPPPCKDTIVEGKVIWPIFPMDNPQWLGNRWIFFHFWGTPSANPSYCKGYNYPKITWIYTVDYRCHGGTHLIMNRHISYHNIIPSL